MKDNNNWDICWDELKRVEFDHLTRRIFTEMSRIVSFQGKSTLEFGCGTGRLSYLARKSGARRVTLVDSSPRAVQIATQLFHGLPDVEIIKEDFLRLNLPRKYDIVFSSGVVEHFPGDEILRALEAHRRHSRHIVLTIVPAGPHYNNLRMKKPEMVRLYGWQRPLTGKETKSIFERTEMKVLYNRRFYPLYAIPRIHSRKICNLLSRPFDRCLGGLLLTVGEINDP